jgi:hypothetical protein
MISTRRLSTVALLVIGLLAIPLIAMQFTTQVNWALSDFVIMGVMLFAVGLGLQWVFRKIKTRWFWAVLILLTFLLVWGELALGIFATPVARS